MPDLCRRPGDQFFAFAGTIDAAADSEGPGVRDDGGVYEGSEVSIYYDPMISKFAVYGKDRQEAIERMRRALSEYEIGGIKTTIPFFREVMEDEEFVAGKLDTGFIGRWQERRKVGEADAVSRDMALIAAAMAFTKAPANLGQAGRSEPQTAQLSRWGVAGRAARLNRHL